MTDSSNLAEEGRRVGVVEMTELDTHGLCVYVCLESYEPGDGNYSMFQVAIVSTCVDVWKYGLSTELVSSYNSLVAAGAHQK